jgi:hypothetical protein
METGALTDKSLVREGSAFALALFAVGIASAAFTCEGLALFNR